MKRADEEDEEEDEGDEEEEDEGDEVQEENTRDELPEKDEEEKESQEGVMADTPPGIELQPASRQALLEHQRQGPRRVTSAVSQAESLSRRFRRRSPALRPSRSASALRLPTPAPSEAADLWGPASDTSDYSSGSSPSTSSSSSSDSSSS